MKKKTPWFSLTDSNPDTVFPQYYSTEPLIYARVTMTLAEIYQIYTMFVEKGNINRSFLYQKSNIFQVLISTLRLFHYK